MLTALLFMYLLTAAPTIVSFSRRNYVNFVRMAVAPIAIGSFWLAGNFVNILSSDLIMKLAFIPLTLPLVAIAVGAVIVARSFYLEDDRVAVLQHVAFNKQYPKTAM